MLTLRCRHAGGALTLQADGGWCVAQLLTHVAGLTGVPLPRLLHGFPPAPLDAASEAPLCSLLRSGDVLVCEPDPTPAPPATVAPRPPPESGRAAASAPVVIPPELPEHVALPNAFGAVLVRRIIAADNSCLFNAVGYALYRDRTGRATELRQLVARVVAADEAGLYTQDFLGRPNAEYCEWIQYSDSWGGAIELSILSAALGVCIYSGDSQTTRVDSYGADESGFTERVLVLYDGVHYDALALAPSAGADEAFDETVLRRDAPSAAAVDAALATLLAAAQAGRRFTDTSAFTLRCLVCRFPLRGQAAAAEHAQATGHTAFGEY